MKRIAKLAVSLSMALCLLTVLFVGASAANAPVNLMATSDDGYTIVKGDGTVSIENGKMILTNNGDGDFRVTIDTKTAFDLTTLHTLHMEFDAEMPFKMAYHIVSDADSTSGWLNTSDNFSHLYTVDTATDRANAGQYNVDMKLDELAATITDKSSVHFEQFIILVTGKGTFTLDVVEMTDGAQSGTDEDTTETTTTVKQEVEDDSKEPVKTGDTSEAVAVAFVALAAAIVVTVSVVSVKAKAN